MVCSILFRIFACYNLNEMRKYRIGNISIVLLFAALHFGVAVLSRMLNYHDDILLTVLTITMVIIVSMRNHTRLDIMAILTLVTTLLGYMIGSWLWRPLVSIIQNDMIAPGVSTFIITTTLGIATELLTSHSKRVRARHDAWSTSARNIAGVAISILVLRLLYFVLFSSKYADEGALINDVMNILSNTWALLILLVGNIIIALRMPTPERDSKRHPIFTHVGLSIILLPTISTIIAYYDIPTFNAIKFVPIDFLRTLSAALLIDLLTITICIFARLSTLTRQELHEERLEKHRSEYRYERLKQQINPHFLFNSLGILDYLVQEQETERASNFIHKLAAIYRYMLRNDQEPLVKLSEEIEFTQRYIDLIKERFINGLEIDIDIEETKTNRYIVPCAVQLLVENATKHNIVSEELPLRIDIYTEEDKLVVRNTLQLRTHGQPSTRLGLENIRQQYVDITGKSISVEKTDNEFIVKLPIV